MSTALQTAVPLDLNVPIPQPTLDEAKKTPSVALVLASQAEEARHLAVQWRDYAEGLRAKNTAVLGRDQVFLVKDGEQRVRCVKANVRLTTEEGHLYCVQGKWNVTANGYTKLNQLAGVTIVQPETIDVDGEPKANPYLEMHPEKPGVLLRVHTRVISIGRTAAGQPVAIDYRLKFDPNLYLLQALKKLQKGTRKAAGPAGAVEDSTQSEFDEARAKGETKGWAFIPFASVGDDFVGIAFNLTNPDVREVIGEHVNLVSFAERRAQTIARRNALRHHPAIAVTTVQVTATAKKTKDGFENIIAGYTDVPIYAWPPDAKSLDDVAQAVLSGVRPVGASVIDEEADPDSDTEESEAVEGEVVVTSEPEASQPEPEPAKPNGNGKAKTKPAETGPLFGGQNGAKPAAREPGED